MPQSKARMTTIRYRPADELVLDELKRRYKIRTDSQVVRLALVALLLQKFPPASQTISADTIATVMDLLASNLRQSDK